MAKMVKSETRSLNEQGTHGGRPDCLVGKSTQAPFTENLTNSIANRYLPDGPTGSSSPATPSLLYRVQTAKIVTAYEPSLRAF